MRIKNHLGKITIWIILISIMSFSLYGYDKMKSQKENSRRLNERIPEKWLHLSTLIGGTPGSFLGMYYFRHKTIKPKFQNVFWKIVGTQVLIVIFLMFIF